MRIFISYGRGDALEFARKLAAWLKVEGFTPWLDVDEGIPPGSPFDVRIELGIEGSDLLIALLSPWSLRPEGFCRNELLYAQAKKRPIIPVRVAEVTPPIQIISLNYLDACVDPDAVFRELKTLIRRVGQGGQMALRDWLDATAGRPWWADQRRLSFQEELARHGDSFTGREWLFEQVREWILQPASRLLLVTAEAGFGKSAVAAQLTARLNVRGVHFCSRSQVESCKPAAWLAGLVYQLAAQFPPFREKLGPTSPDWNQPGESLFRALIADPLRDLANQLPVAEPWVFVVDALDESVAETGAALADLLADSAERIPNWLRVIVTSRPDENIIAQFKRDQVRCEYLDAEGEPNRHDVSRYIAGRVERLENKGVIVRRAGTAERLGELAAGNFLFARLTLDALTDADLKLRLSLDEMGALPPKLGGLYHAMFRKRFRDVTAYRREILPLLEVLVAARGPLPKELLQEVSGLTQRDFQPGLSQISQFLNGGASGYRLFHQSLADWLADGGKAGHFCVSVVCGHRALADFGWREFSDSSVKMSAYSARHLARHLMETGDRDRLVKLCSSKQAFDRAEVLDSLVNVLIELDWKESISALWAGSTRPCSDMLLTILRESGGDCAKLLFPFADASEVLGRWERAFEVLTWVRNWSINHSPQAELAALIALAQIESSRGNARDGLLLAHRAYKLAEEGRRNRDGAADPVSVIQFMRTANTLGRALFDMGNIDGLHNDYLKDSIHLFNVVQRVAREAASAGIRGERIDRQLGRALNNLGVIRRLKGQTARARLHQTKAWKLREASGNFRDQAWSLRDLAWLDWDGGFLERAHSRFQEALALAEKAGSPQAQLWVLRDLAKFHEVSSRNKRSAIHCRHRAWAIMAEMPAVDTYYDLGGYVGPSAGTPITLNDLATSAQAWYGAAAAWHSRQNRPWAVRGRANALRGLAWTYWSIGTEDLARASEILKQEWPLRIETGEMRETAQSLVAYARLGFRAIGRADTKLGENIFSNMLTCVESLPAGVAPQETQRVLAAAHYGLANLRLAEDNLEAALKHFEKTRILRESADSSRLGSVLARIGACHLEMGKLPEAEKCLVQAITVSRQWHDAEAETSACRHLSKVHMDRLKGSERNVTKAQEYAEKARDAAGRSSAESIIEEALNALGDVKLVQGHLEEARRHDLDALHHATESGRLWSICRCLLALAIVEARDGRIKPAVRYCRRASALARDASSAKLAERAQLVENYLDAMRANSGVSQAYERLREKEFRWLPDNAS